MAEGRGGSEGGKASQLRVTQHLRAVGTEFRLPWEDRDFSFLKETIVFLILWGNQEKRKRRGRGICAMGKPMRGP